MHKSSERSDDGCVWNEDAPTVVSCAFFRLSEPVVIFNHRLFLCFSVLLGRKQKLFCEKEKKYTSDARNWLELMSVQLMICDSSWEMENAEPYIFSVWKIENAEKRMEIGRIKRKKK